MSPQHVHLQTVIKQGESIKFLHQQQEDPTWKGYLHNKKKGTMKFIPNSDIHTLPTMNNLKQWKKVTLTNVIFARIETVLFAVFLGVR